MSTSEYEDATDVDMSTGDFETSEGDTILGDVHPQETVRYARLVEWNAAMFEELVKQVIVHHQMTLGGGGVKKTLDNVVKKTINTIDNFNPLATINDRSSTMTREEVVEILSLPKFDSRTAAATILWIMKSSS
jgi:hypothetical protein